MVEGRLSGVLHRASSTDQERRISKQEARKLLSSRSVFCIFTYFIYSQVSSQEYIYGLRSGLNSGDPGFEVSVQRTSR